MSINIGITVFASAMYVICCDCKPSCLDALGGDLMSNDAIYARAIYSDKPRRVRDNELEELSSIPVTKPRTAPFFRVSLKSDYIAMFTYLNRC